MVLVLYTHDHGKTAKKPTVMSILPWIGRQTVVATDVATDEAGTVVATDVATTGAIA